MKKIKYNLLSLLCFVFFLAVWQVLSVFPRVKFFVASPLLVWQSLQNNFVQLLSHTLVTGIESILGLFIGLTLGVVIGFLLWYSPLVARVFKPYIVVAGAVPVFAFAPVVILWFGIGITMKIALSAFGVFLIALSQSYEGASNINLSEFNSLKIIKATKFQTLKKVIFPSSLSWVLASMKLCVGFSLLGSFIGEFISANRGLGYFMLRAGSLYDIPSVFAGALFLVLLAIIFNFIVNLIEKKRISIVRLFSVDYKVRKLINKVNCF